MRTLCLFSLFLVDAGIAGAVVIERTAIQQVEGGLTVTTDYEFRPSEMVYFTFHLAKFETIENDDKQKVELTYQIEVADAFGTPVVEPQTGQVKTEIFPEDRNWSPKGHWSFPLPDFADDGKYTITLTVHDVIGKADTKTTSHFLVRNRKVEPSDVLVARSFAFYPSEESVRVLDPAVYHSGELVWVKFDLTGYKLGPKNDMDVVYGLTVLDPSGKVSFTQPEAAREKLQSFYPRRWVPAIFNLTLPGNVTKGTFTLVVAIHDHVGKQELEIRREFTVE